MHVMNRSWSATKQHLHPQSVAELSAVVQYIIPTNHASRIVTHAHYYYYYYYYYA